MLMNMDFHFSHRTGPRGNNPHASRFDKPAKKDKNRFPRVAFVLQGGGALGAYQAGAVRKLLTSGYEPDWIAATSIGSIQGAIIAGNPPEARLKKLAEFWELVATESPFSTLADLDQTRSVYDHMMESSAVFSGQPNFYSPRWMRGEFPFVEEPDKLSYYDTTPLRDTLLKLIDFDYLNQSPIRLSLGSVQVKTGYLLYFNNINYLIEPEHVMASGALPPAFPAIKIDNEYYWDGGVHSNSPLSVILEAYPSENTLCFLIDCFGGNPFVPHTIAEVQERMKDITYGMHAQQTLIDYAYRQVMKKQVCDLYSMLTPEQKKQYEHKIDNFITAHHCTLVHLACSSAIVKGAAKDYNFGKVNLIQREQIGYRDSSAAIEEEKEWGFLPKNGSSRLYEGPYNLSRIMREKPDGGGPFAPV
jgi:NTE family protein